MSSLTTSRLQELKERAKANERARKLHELAVTYEAGQLALWPESERGVPNEMLRCALFSAKNRKEARQRFVSTRPLRVPVIGGGEIRYIGEELRQDDQTVWMQLVHLAKEARSESVTFTPYGFVKALHWPINGQSYTRLLATLRRLASSKVEVYSKRLDLGKSISLVRDYEYSEGHEKPWTVHVFDQNHELFFLFDKLYSRLEWETRLALPEGVTTWLHGFFASHKQPYSHKVETLAIGAGLALELPEDASLLEREQIAKRKGRLREAKRSIIKGLDSLKATGFLKDYAVSREGLVTVVRA